MSFPGDIHDPIPAKEISVARKCIQSWKSPGPDVFPTEYYKKFSDKLSPLFGSIFAGQFNPFFNPRWGTVFSLRADSLFCM